MTKDRTRTDTPIIAVVGGAYSVDGAFTKYGAYSFGIRDKKDEKAAIQFADGIVFTGGGDVNPSRYGEHRWHPDVYGVSEERDDQEFRIVALARKRGIPMFGICRGLQVLNVAHGGTLHQDIDQYDATHLHHYGGQHDIFLREGTGIQRSLDVMQVKGTSLHHQAIDRMGEGLLPAGASIDGLVEMIESAEGVWPYVLATQFHPEMDHKDKDNEAAGGIFKHFVSVCALKAGRRKPLEVRRQAMWKARGFSGQYGGGNSYTNRGNVTSIVPHSADKGTSTVDEWRSRNGCPHGYKYHCQTSDLCKFNDQGYISTGFVRVGSEDSKRRTCTHGAVYHSTDKADDGMPCHFDGNKLFAASKELDDIDAALDNMPVDHDTQGWKWSASLEAWVPIDHDENDDDSEDYKEWLEIQAKWNNAVREVDDMPTTLEQFAEYDDLDGWC